MSKKNILIGLTAIIVAVGMLPLLAAFEAHVINVTAHIENALAVNPDEIAFGTVFPEEVLEENFSIFLSDSFKDQDRVTTVNYKFEEKLKPGYEDRSLCPFIEVKKGPSCDPNDEVNSAWLVNDSDIIDTWTLELDVPCIEGYCPEGETPGITEEDDYGCDIWVLVQGIS